MADTAKSPLSRLTGWLLPANLHQALDLLFKWASLIAALTAIQFFTEPARATIESVDAMLRIDLRSLEELYRENDIALPPDLRDFARWFNQEPGAPAPDWAEPSIRDRFLTPVEAFDTALISEFNWAATCFDEDCRQQPTVLRPPDWAWDWKEGESSKEYDFAVRALADSQYGIFAVNVKSEGAVKDVVVSSLVDGMYYVDDHGQVTQRMQSDPLDLKEEEIQVKFQMHFGRQMSVILGDLHRYFDIKCKPEGQFFSRSRATGWFCGGAVVVALLAVCGAVVRTFQEQAFSRGV